MPEVADWFDTDAPEPLVIYRDRRAGEWRNAFAFVICLAAGVVLLFALATTVGIFLTWLARLLLG